MTDKIHVLSRLMDAGQELASSTDLDELLTKIMRASQELTDSDRASILLLDEERNELYFRQSQGELGELRSLIRVPVSDRSVAGSCVLSRQPQLVPDVTADHRHYKAVDQATSYITRSILAIPIIWGERCFGVLEVINRTIGTYTYEDVEYLTILAAQAAVALNNVYVVEQLQNFFVHTVELLISALETIDPTMRGHAVRVARLATGLARELGMSGKELEQIMYGAYFHEIGRLVNTTTSCTGARDRDEPLIGAQLLEKIKLLEKVAPIVRYYRERYDGSGYPEGLRGDKIPLAARILGLVVEYDEEYIRNLGRMPTATFQQLFFENAATSHDPRLLELFRKVTFAQRDRLEAESARAAAADYIPTA
jgi:response regulator RpfG family c-di-GMP phosphodiesterase